MRVRRGDDTEACTNLNTAFVTQRTPISYKRKHTNKPSRPPLSSCLNDFLTAIAPCLLVPQLIPRGFLPCPSLANIILQRTITCFYVYTKEYSMNNSKFNSHVFCLPPAPRVSLQSGNIMYDDTITPNAAAPPPALAPQARAFEGENGAIIAVPHPSEHPSPVPASSTPSASPGTVSFAGRLSLIDYEYSGYNPRGFDLGNHFCEWMADYEKANPHVLDFDSYPEAEEKWRFCRTYLGATLGVSGYELVADII